MFHYCGGKGLRYHEQKIIPHPMHRQIGDDLPLLREEEVVVRLSVFQIFDVVCELPVQKDSGFFTGYTDNQDIWKKKTARRMGIHEIVFV